MKACDTPRRIYTLGKNNDVKKTVKQLKNTNPGMNHHCQNFFLLMTLTDDEHSSLLLEEVKEGEAFIQAEASASVSRFPQVSDVSAVLEVMHRLERNSRKVVCII